MNKPLIAALSIIVCCQILSAQEKEFKFGLHVFPSIAYSRVSPKSFAITDTKTNNYQGNGVKLHGGFGAFTDYHVTDNFVVHGGINFLVVGSGYQINSHTGSNFEESHSLQYLQLPIGLKIISNEIHNHMYISFMAAITAEVTLSARVNGDREYQPSPGAPLETYYSFFKPLNSSLILNPGIEYRMNNNFRLLLGITYCRGLIDYTKAKGQTNLPNDLSVKNDFVALNLGVKF